MMGPMSVVIDQTPNAVERRCGGKIAMRRPWLPGIIGPETAPCSTRKNTSDSRLQARPQSSEAMVNSTTEATKVRTTPKRPISQPVSGTVTPFATANEVTTQLPWLVLAPRLPAMVGSDTLAMVESSTCMKVPSASAKATSASWAPCIGAWTAPAGALLMQAYRRWR